MNTPTEQQIGARDAAEWERLVRQAERQGDLLGAYDRALRGLAEHPEDVTLRYRAVLNLSRSGASDRASALFAAYGLDASEEVRIASLGARLLRERALEAEGSASASMLAVAARRYEEIYARSGETFPGVNGAALYQLAGEVKAARHLAGQVLARCLRQGVQTYDLAADAAAAALIAGDLASANAFVSRCKELHAGNFIAVAATRRQLARICDSLQIRDALLTPLTQRMVIHYTGHIISPPGMPGRFPAAAETPVAAQIAYYLERHDVGFGFGSLACGADILCAEALLARDAELHVVLPFERKEFCSHSVACGGADWEQRFDACIARASSLTYATDDEYLGDRVLFRHASQLAMGLALLRADYLHAPVRQLRVWDAAEGSREAGTSADVALWRGKGLPGDTIHSQPSTRATGPALTSHERTTTTPHRVIKAILFGDTKGFSRLTERQIPVFVERFLAPLGLVFDRYGDRVEHRNTWGDGLYIVMSDPRSAMHCALDLQEAVNRIDLAASGLPPDLALRISGHAGPVFDMTDPILGVRGFLGGHVSRTARIEPITPEGQVYVTEAFAALIALEREPGLSCEYVGVVPAAKHYGSFRMYVLKRAAPPNRRIATRTQ